MSYLACISNLKGRGNGILLKRFLLCIGVLALWHYCDLGILEHNILDIRGSLSQINWKGNSAPFLSFSRLDNQLLVTINSSANIQVVARCPIVAGTKIAELQQGVETGVLSVLCQAQCMALMNIGGI